MTSLDQLRIGEQATIVSVEGEDSLVQRLLEMGLLEGAAVEVLGFAPFGDPMEIRLRDYRLSLRRQEASRVSVKMGLAPVAETTSALGLLSTEAVARPSPETLQPARAERSTNAGPFTLALIGNPNTGKTTLFNALAGMRQKVGNYPGVTVETKKGHFTIADRAFDLIDLPGTYSLAPRSPDEMLVLDLLLGRQSGSPRPDLILSIVDASNLERNLYLTTQLLEVEIPVVLALNMTDVADAQGLQVDVESLSRSLGIPVVPIQANRRVGLDQLRAVLSEAAEKSAERTPKRTDLPAFPSEFIEEELTLREAIGTSMPPFLVRRLLLDVGGWAEQTLVAEKGDKHSQTLAGSRDRLAQKGITVASLEAHVRYAWVRERLNGCLKRPTTAPVNWTDRIDRVVTHRVWGTFIFAALMFLVFQAIFSWASPLMDLFNSAKDTLADVVRTALPPGPLASLLADGVIEGVGGVLVFLPQILILFGFIAILEDCGYMARAAFLMDRVMARAGLSGKSFIPMLSSVACAVPGIMATRVIENRRDRLVTILVAPLMSCSARLPVYALLIGAFLTEGYPFWVPGLTLFAMYALGIVVAPLVAFALKRTVLRGETPAFVLEMPLYRWPSPLGVVRRMFEAGWAFLRRAGTIIIACMILVWALLSFPRTGPNGPYDVQLEELRREIVTLEEKNGYEKAAVKQELRNELNGTWRRHSYLGQLGRALEPIFVPLGWDWKIGMAALASFPAREVIVGTLGIIYNQGAEDEESEQLGQTLRSQVWENQPERKVFSVPVALSLMVFFALCCQCASTLAVIKRETNSWRWPVVTFVYMTVLAYVAALLVYQVGSRLM